MCLCPKTIFNKRLDFRLGIDKQFITVPCGHCEQCIEEKKNDMFVRLYYEWERSNRNCLFLTFTFNESHLPLVDLNKLELKGIRGTYKVPEYKDIKSFDKTGFMKCLKKIHTYLSREYGDIDVKHLVVCENGPKNNRPHYHVLFFLNGINIDSEDFRIICMKAWSEEVKIQYYDKKKKHRMEQQFQFVPEIVETSAIKYFDENQDSDIFNPENEVIYEWFATRDKYSRIHYHNKFGFVNYSLEFGARIKSVKALNYCTKYIFKDERFMNLPAIQDIWHFSKLLPALCNCDTPELVHDVRTIKDIFPFCLVSNGLGDSLYNELQDGCEDPSKSAETIKRICKNKISIDTKEYQYKIPRYVIRKLFYETTDCVRYDTVNNMSTRARFYDLSQKTYITNLGKECLVRITCDKLSSMTHKYKVYWSDDFIRSLFPYCTEVQKLQLQSAFDSRKLNVNLYILPFYKLFLKDVLLYGFDTLTNFIDPDSQGELIFEHCQNMVRKYYDTYNVFYEDVVTPYASSDDYKYFYNKYGVFNDLEIFRNYDEMLAYFQIVDCIVGDLRTKSEAVDKVIADSLRRFYKSLIYV